MKFKIPGMITIGCHTYTVVFPHHFREKTGVFGQCDNCLHEIRISENDQGGAPRPDTAILVTFFHEILHAIDSKYANGIIADLETDKAELIISQLAEGLTQLFLNGQFPVETS